VLTADGGRTELWGGFFYASRGTDRGAAAIDLTGSELLGNWVNHLGGSYQPQLRHRQGERTDELWLHVDFSDLSALNLIRKEMRGMEVVEAVKSGQSEQTTDALYRHGTYGVKLPLIGSAPTP
jgi:hypothetical protein